MFRRIHWLFRPFLLASGGLLAASWMLAAASAEAQGRPPACGAFPAGSDSYLCHCDAGRPGGSVWGSDPYTADSDICTAAKHAGALAGADGDVTAFAAPGQADYPGTLRNGIQTGGWGQYDASFTFRAPEAAMNSRRAAGSQLPQCGGFPSDADDLSCYCPPAEGATGSVWGSGPYTADSDLCSAARHDGSIGAAGGDVSFVVAPGLAAYRGTSVNGIETSDWGSYARSFVVDHNAN